MYITAYSVSKLIERPSHVDSTVITCESDQVKTLSKSGNYSHYIEAATFDKLGMESGVLTIRTRCRNATTTGIRLLYITNNCM